MDGNLAMNAHFENMSEEDNNAAYENHLMNWHTSFENVLLSSNMLLGFGSEINDVKHVKFLDSKNKYVIFSVGYTYYLTKQTIMKENIGFVECWTKQFDSHLSDVKKYADSQQ